MQQTAFLSWIQKSFTLCNFVKHLCSRWPLRWLTKGEENDERQESRKEGCSWIDVDNKVYSFLIGDRTPANGHYLCTVEQIFRLSASVFILNRIEIVTIFIDDYEHNTKGLIKVFTDDGQQCISSVCLKCLRMGKMANCGRDGSQQSAFASVHFHVLKGSNKMHCLQWTLETLNI